MVNKVRRVKRQKREPLKCTTKKIRRSSMNVKKTGVRKGKEQQIKEKENQSLIHREAEADTSLC